MKQKLSLVRWLMIWALSMVLGVHTAYAVSTPVPTSALPALPVPHRAVNDFAGVVDASASSSMEKKLSDYYTTTTIAIVVVTVKDLGNYDYQDYALSLYNYWGVGSKSNVGALILVAPNEHKCQIATGVGMEAYLPDAICSRIFSNDMVPWFKKNDYSQGIVAGVDAIISYLGTMSVEERIAIAKQKEIAEARERQILNDKIKSVVMDILLVAAIIGFIVWIVWMVKSSRRRRVLRTYLKKIADDAKNGTSYIKQMIEQFKNEPAWARQELSSHFKSCTESLEEAMEKIETSSKLLGDRDTIGEAEIMSHEAAQLIEKAKTSFNIADSKLREKIAKFSKDAPVTNALSITKAQQEQLVLEGLSKEGYRFQRINDEVKRTIDELVALKGKLADKEAHRDVCLQSIKNAEYVKELVDTAREQVSGKVKIDSLIPELQKQATGLRNATDTHSKVLNELKELYPKSVWSELAAGFITILRLVGEDRISQLTASIMQANSIETQDFRKAQSLYDTTAKEIGSVKDFFKKIIDTKTAQEKAKQDFPKIKTTADVKVGKALDIVKDPDVTSKTKDLAKTAQQQLVKAQVASGGTLIDWCMLCMLFSKCADMADEAIKKAASEKSEAAAKRRRIAEEAAEEERNARRRREESSSSYSSGSSWGSSGGGGGFGGFGGGMSGGGGGGGSW